MRRIAVVTTSRADWGIYRPLLAAIAADPELELRLVVAGMHLAPEFGQTARDIAAEGWEIAATVECLLSSDTGQGAAMSLGLAVMGYGQALTRIAPDLLVVLGDRFEMFAAAAAAAPLRLPVAHLYGGELTLGAMDDAFRHAITKLSHLHFVATADYARRVVQMGEEPWRVTLCGALSLDNLARMTLPTRDELERELGLCLEPAPLLVTYHPETLSPQDPADQMAEVLAALAEFRRPCVFTLPNADPGGRGLAAMVQEFCAANPWAQVRDNLGSRRYFGLMRQAAAMVGNSSSGIIEAPSLGLPVVNVGGRQAGRTRGANVIDAACRRDEIAAGIERACRLGWKEALAGLPNPYDRGGAAAIILAGLKSAPPAPELLRKEFIDCPIRGHDGEQRG
ncbi:MAG: UDP-N-acetylglucosamine 2-epimerase [Thermodesulfobacteriota bacterium]